MRIGLGFYREMLTPDNFRFAVQAGATHVVAHLTNYFAGLDPKIAEAMKRQIDTLDFASNFQAGHPGAFALAERIAENAPLAVAASKALVRAAASGIEEDKLWEMQVPLQKKVFSSNDAKEGPAAFAEKRAPNWTGT